MKKIALDPNAKIAFGAAAIALTMVGAAFAAVPLYDLFCRVTGYGGTVRVAEAESSTVLDREMRVRFDSNVAGGLPWDFEPIEPEVTLPVGQSALVYYRATNTSDRPVTGVASFNVAPFKAATYFSKVECFCFVNQTLQPGESIEMPVLFFIDPLIAEEKRLDDVNVMTLSYTFYETETDESGLAAAATSGRGAAPSR